MRRNISGLIRFLSRVTALEKAVSEAIEGTGRRHRTMNQATFVGYRKAFFRKLVQFENLIAKLSFIIDEIEYQRSVLGSLCHADHQSIQDHTFQQVAALARTCDSDRGPVLERYEAAYRKKIRSAETKMNGFIQSQADALAVFEKEAADEIQDLQITIRQLTHNVVTASNALDAQCKLTIREMNVNLEASKARFQSALRSHDQESSEKVRDFERESQKKLAMIKENYEQKLEQRKRRQVPRRRRISGDVSPNLLRELAEMRQTVLVIVNAYRSRIGQQRKKVAAIVAELARQRQESALDDGMYVTFKQLDKELMAKISDQKAANESAIKQNQIKLENMKLLFQMDQRSHKQALEVRGEEVIQLSRDAHCALTELLKEKSDQLRVVRDGYRMEEDAIQSNLRNLKLQIAKTQEVLTQALIQARDSAKSDRADSGIQISLLLSSY
jgi:hypothetical protein